MENITISLYWLSHHVVSVNVEVSVFDGSLEISVITIFMLLMYFFLNQFKFVLIKCAVADSISQNFDSFVNITLENLELEVCEFSSGISLENSA